jgi:hypothetical protein
VVVTVVVSIAVASTALTCFFEFVAAFPHLLALLPLAVNLAS